MGNVKDDEEIWVNGCYSSFHQILLVGEGDFSFSLSLALSFASASNMVATSLDSYDTLVKKYKSAKSHLDQLEKLGASLIHGLDATKMKLQNDLKMRKFDRIVYNFPHAGFHGKEDDSHIIQKHRRLVDGFFHNASGMLRPDGEIHVRHKSSPPFCHWNLSEIAFRNSLLLVECVPFKIGDYPGYNNKRGDGLRSDKPFPLGECHTYKFILSIAHKKVTRSCQQTSLRHHCPANGIPSSVEFQLNTYSVNHPEYQSYSGNVVPTHLGPPVNYDKRTAACLWIFDCYINHVRQTYGLPEERIVHNVQEAVSRGYERFVHMDPGKPSRDFVVHLEELHRLSLLRIQWLEQNLASRRSHL